MLVLGIETSCDETSVACVADGRDILSVVTATQIEAHGIYGGVVPEIASRIHAESLGQVTRQALAKAGVGLRDVSLVAATNAPGLLGALLVGVSFSNALALAAQKKCVGIHHLEAHIYSAFMENPDLRPPALALLVSGGHTVIVMMRGFGDYRIVGSTLDDAAGEAFDKVSFYLGLGYPGGPAIQKAAENGDPGAFKFPRAMAHHKRKHDFSFSGLKTSVINRVQAMGAAPEELDSRTKSDIAASFQEAVVDSLVAKTMSAAEAERAPAVILSGGVAASSRLREKLKEACGRNGIKLIWPSLALCGDNAAMVAGLAFHKAAEAGEFIADVSAVKTL